MYREFEYIRDLLPGEANLNTTTTYDHMADIEYNNRVIKERARALISNFPFMNIPGQIIITVIRFVGLWLNQEPSDNGVSAVNSTQNIIIGQDIAYDKNCKLIFGYYVGSHEYRTIPNNME